MGEGEREREHMYVHVFVDAREGGSLDKCVAHQLGMCAGQCAAGVPVSLPSEHWEDICVTGHSFSCAC